MSFGSFERGASSPVSEINMVPLIDVMLVLLVIFIVTAPLLTHAVKIDLPKASSHVNPTKPENIQLGIRADGEIFWNGGVVAHSALEERFKAAARAEPQPELHVRADSRTEYRQRGRRDVHGGAGRSDAHRLRYGPHPRASMNGRAHWVLAAWFVIAIALVPQPGAYAAQPDASAQLVVHLLDYISVDYPTFVKVGKVTDASEYKEQQEFATQVVTLLGQLPEVRERTELLSEASRLKRRIDARAPGEEVSKAATDLRWRVIGAYGIAVVPKRPPDLQLGARLYSSQCAGCHGASGHGDGVLAKGLDPAPADFHDHDRVAQRSVYGFYNSITLGVTGTAMKSFSELPEEDRWALAFHVAALGADPARTAAAEQLWKGGRGKTEAGNLRALATLTENDVARRYGEDVATVFVWLRAHPATLESAQSSPIAYARSGTRRESRGVSRRPA